MARLTKAEKERQKWQQFKREYKEVAVSIYLDGHEIDGLEDYLRQVAVDNNFDPNEKISLVVEQGWSYSDASIVCELKGYQKRTEEELAALDKEAAEQQARQRKYDLAALERLKKQYPEEI